MACAAWTNVRRVCNYRVDVRVAIGARLVVSIRSYSSHVTDKGLKNEHYRCDPVAIWGLGQGWARNAPTYTHVPPPTARAEGRTRVTGQLSTSEGAWHRLLPETACRRPSWLWRDAGAGGRGGWQRVDPCERRYQAPCACSPLPPHPIHTCYSTHVLFSPPITVPVSHTLT